MAAGGMAADTGRTPGAHPGASRLQGVAYDLARIRPAYERVAAFSFPSRFPIVQFPNVALIVALAGSLTAGVLGGRAHSYALSVYYLAITIWAYQELADGVNWFRRLLGVAVLLLSIVRVAHALEG
jgi:hypothetical protein